MNDLERKIYDLLVEAVSISRIRGLRRCGEIAIEIAGLIKPNRVVVEVKGNVVTAVRADRPDELHVMVIDRDIIGPDEVGFCTSVREVEQLMTVKEEKA